jgi:hypothetical protein
MNNIPLADVYLNIRRRLFIKFIKKIHETELPTIKINTFAASFPKYKKSVKFLAG